ncbi:MAG TPA: hypothetical protein VEZ20_15775 [Allosphingosinicella sp.]|jgi:hypothetical protein|nr:hypothetical protein [Allosphingosinicella sp.]
MFYVIPALTLGMLAYMVWLVTFRLRRERVATERELTRGKRAFSRPKQRLRFLLHRSFRLPDEKPDWEEPLVSTLAKAPAAAPEGEARGTAER